jgi:serine protease Do
MPNAARIGILRMFFAMLATVVVDTGVEAAAARSVTRDARLDARSTYRAASGLVFQLKTAVTADAAKASYGTAFAVSKSGLLATNYHVVRSAVVRPGRYRCYIVLADKAVEAEVVEIDIVNDLALVKVPVEFQGALELAPGASASHGDRLYSLGLPEDLSLSVVEGNFNGLQKSALYEHIVLSSPINPGMSGGPTLNDRGKVVGVNVAIMRKAQNISFAIPAARLARLIARHAARKQNARTPASPTKTDGWNGEIARQLEKAQDALTRAWLTGAEAPRSVRMGTWNLPAPPPGLKCWRNKEAAGKGLEIEAQQCHSLFSSSPEAEIHAGSYELGYANLLNTKLTPLLFYDALNSFFERLPARLAEDFARSSDDSSKAFTAPECGERVVVNERDVSMKVSYCMAGLVNYGELVDAVVKLVTLGSTRDAVMLTLRLRGFRPENAKALVERLIQGVEKT